MLVKGEDLAKLKTQRGGVIPYIVVNQSIFFLVGKYANYNKDELTDFGGRREQYDESALHTSLREFKEETISMFNEEYYTVEILSKCVALYDKNYIKGKYDANGMCIIFLPVSMEWFRNAVENFETSKKKATKDCEKEISGLMWISMKQLETQIQNTETKLWKKVQYFLKENFKEDINDILMTQFDK